MKAHRGLGMTLCGLSLLLAAGNAWAGSDQRVGTGGGLELRMPVGSRGIAMAGANLGDVSGVEALFYNPAGLAASDLKTEVSFSHTNYIADIAVNYFGVGQSLGGVGMLGISVKVLSIGDIPLTTETAPDGTGEVFSPTFSTLGLTYARQMTDRVNFGGTVYYTSEKVMQVAAAGVAFDFGFQYDTGMHGMKLGMAMKNFGPNQEFAGSDFESIVHLPGDNPQSGNKNVALGSASFNLPASFGLALSLPVVRGTNTLDLHGLYQNNSFGLDEGRFGGEFTMKKMFALRAGYILTSDKNALFTYSYGLGLRVPFGGSHLWIDYAGQPVSNYFDDVQHISLTMQF